MVTSIHPQEQNIKTDLHSTTDAVVWAEEFMLNFSDRLEDIDEGLMIAWFANAIMAGIDSKNLSPFCKECGSSLTQDIRIKVCSDCHIVEGITI